LVSTSSEDVEGDARPFSTCSIWLIESSLLDESRAIAKFQNTSQFGSERSDKGSTRSVLCQRLNPAAIYNIGPNLPSNKSSDFLLADASILTPSLILSRCHDFIRYTSTPKQPRRPHITPPVPLSSNDTSTPRYRPPAQPRIPRIPRTKHSTDEPSAICITKRLHVVRANLGQVCGEELGFVLGRAWC
jgi:hypothetical protein